MRIQVHTFVSLKSWKFLEYAVENYRQMMSGLHEVTFTVHCLDVIPATQVEALGCTPGGTFAGSRGSGGHAAGIRNALATMDGDINIICDSDTVMVMKGWDDVIVKALDEVQCAGTTWERKGGVTSGTGMFQAHKGTPNMCWFAMKGTDPWRKLQCVPDKTRPLSVTTEQDAKVYGLSIGHTVLRDCGWEIPQFIFDNNISFKIFDHVKFDYPESKVMAGPCGWAYTEEFHFEGVPFMCHHRGSMKHAFRFDHASGVPMSEWFYAKVEAYIKGLP